MEQSKGQEHRCENCPVRASAEANPKALLSRIWRWHTGWCPGWRAYQQSLQAANKK